MVLETQCVFYTHITAQFQLATFQVLIATLYHTENTGLGFGPPVDVDHSFL